jgi:hypothetical protein
MTSGISKPRSAMSRSGALSPAERIGVRLTGTVRARNGFELLKNLGKHPPADEASANAEPSGEAPFLT